MRNVIMTGDRDSLRYRAATRDMANPRADNTSRSLARETLLLGIALIMFGTWSEGSGLGGWPFAVSGLGIAALGIPGECRVRDPFPAHSTSPS